MRVVAHKLRSALRGRQAASAHFIKEYDVELTRLLSQHDLDEAMQRITGGNYDAMGRIEADILVHLGLRDGQAIVDVGCGAGRLSTAVQHKARVDYHGTDILRDALDYARSRAPSHYRFTEVTGLEIPAPSGSADFVTFFSVVTHLMHHETYLYLEEARRVAKPSGHIVLSFLELTNPSHWPVFERTVRSRRRNNRAHLNAFIEPDVLKVLTSDLALEVVAIHHGGTRWVPLTEDVTFEGGRVVSGLADLGQSVAILRKPSG